MQERVEISYKGVVYTGHYFVEGVNNKQLTVYHRGQKLTDNFDSRAEQPGYVEFWLSNYYLSWLSNYYLR